MAKKQLFFEAWASFFFLSAVLFIPFSFALIRFQFELTHFLFGGLIRFTAESLFHIPLRDTGVYSDSVTMYILLLLLLLLAFIIALVMQWLKKGEVAVKNGVPLIRTVLLAYLIVILLKYGLDKIFKTQFYLPEPNTLYTPMGQLSRDILFWSSMGTSHAYNIFLGSVEVLAAIFLFFRRTRLLGLLIGAASLIHIVAVNFSFDISVKLFSVFLLLLTLYLLRPYYKKLSQFFFTAKETGTVLVGQAKAGSRFRNLKIFVPVSAALFILAESFYPYIRTHNFNDDQAQRPYLHGAYEVQFIMSGKDTLPASHLPVKRFFIHRDQYFIIQDQQDAMHDYKLVTNNATQQFVLKDYQLRERKLQFNYNPEDSVLLLQYFSADTVYWLHSKVLDWKKMPALQKEFNWTMDSP
jgi:hypothetical protein